MPIDTNADALPAARPGGSVEAGRTIAFGMLAVGATVVAAPDHDARPGGEPVALRQ